MPEPHERPKVRRASGPRRARAAARAAVAALAGLGACGLGCSTASAQRVENGTAVFAALDKVTAKISRLEVKLNETATFGALKLTPRACYSRPPTEPPKTTTFIEVEEVLLDGKKQRIFSGWMFAESPALNPLEHPVFDIWLTDCTAPLRPATAERGPQPGRGQRQPGPPGSVGAAAGQAVQQGPTGPQGQPSAGPVTDPPQEEFRRRRPRGL